MTEITRIGINNNGERPQNSFALFKAVCNNPQLNLAKVKEVIEVIAKTSKKQWLSDEEWEQRLPMWFVVIIKNNTTEMIINNPVLWDFGSWLDALKYREWEWFSSKILPDGFEIVVEVNAVPYSINPLEYVIIESGISPDSITFNELL